MLVRCATTFTVVSLLAGCGKEAPAPQPQLPAGSEVAPAPRPSALSPFQVLGVLDDAKRDAASLKCGTIEQAIQAYMLRPQSNGNPPTSLEVLVSGDPASGLPPMLEGGPKALLDPWGKPFVFDMVADGDFPRPCVMTTGPDGKPIYSRRWESKLKAKK